MRTTSDFILSGAKPQNLTVDGQLYNSTKIYLQLPIHDGVGTCTTEYEFGTYENYDQFKNLPMPCPVSVDFEIVTTGRRQKTIIHSVKPKAQITK